MSTPLQQRLLAHLEQLARPRHAQWDRLGLQIATEFDVLLHSSDAADYLPSVSTSALPGRRHRGAAWSAEAPVMSLNTSSWESVVRMSQHA